MPWWVCYVLAFPRCQCNPDFRVRRDRYYVKDGSLKWKCQIAVLNNVEQVPKYLPFLPGPSQERGT